MAKTSHVSLMDRFIDTIEWLAAAFVGIVAVDIFVSVLLRYFFAVSIPDSYDFGKLLLGILIFWGIAATSYRGTHITVDLVWSAVGPRGKRLIDIFATLVLLFVVTVRGPSPTSCSGSTAMMPMRCGPSWPPQDWSRRRTPTVSMFVIRMD